MGIRPSQATHRLNGIQGLRSCACEVGRREPYQERLRGVCGRGRTSERGGKRRDVVGGRASNWGVGLAISIEATPRSNPPTGLDRPPLPDTLSLNRTDKHTFDTASPVACPRYDHPNTCFDTANSVPNHSTTTHPALPTPTHDTALIPCDKAIHANSTPQHPLSL